MDIKALRKKAKLTQLELSKKVGVSRSTIAQYETGVAQPGVRMLVILAQLFNVDLNDMKATVAAESPIQPLQRPAAGPKITEASVQKMIDLSERLERLFGDVKRTQAELMKELRKMGRE